MRMELHSLDRTHQHFSNSSKVDSLQRLIDAQLVLLPTQIPKQLLQVRLSFSPVFFLDEPDLTDVDPYEHTT